MQTQKSIATLSKQALQHNIIELKKRAPQSKLLAMIKANAYGHGILRISEVVAPLVDGVGVATVAEALKLRLQYPLLPKIVVMNGVLYLDELSLAFQHDLTIVLHHRHELDLLEQYVKSHVDIIKKPLSIWVQIDTGMHRLGFLPEEIPHVLSKLSPWQNKKIVYLQVWMTHFSAADDLSDPANQEQLNSYDQYIAPLPGEKSLANSAAILQMPESHQDWIRPGLLLYGASPISGMAVSNLGFKPVMTLTSQILAIRRIYSGTRIGYNGTWQAKRDSVIATIGIGYGDGYPRHIAENTPVWIQAQCFPIVGRVSMDMMMVDITDNPFIQNIAIGTTVELWGEHIAIEEVAKQANTIPYELFCQLTNRISFRWGK